MSKTDIQLIHWLWTSQFIHRTVHSFRFLIDLDSFENPKDMNKSYSLYPVSLKLWKKRNARAFPVFHRP